MEKISASKLLAGLVPADFIREEVQVELVTTDSREVRPGCIFVAFPGEKFDGHDFAAKALENGAVYVVVNHPVEGVPAEKAILCPDSYHAMMVMGANYRSQYHPKMVGVTGSVGKTTTIAKLAYLYKDLGKRIMLAAGDTFRAAASEQLETWADRAGVPLVKAGEGADPAAVIFDAVKSATARGYDMVIADTAGRLHNKKGLMDELAKISRSVKKASPDASLEVLLVLDAITGQNAISQAQEFCRAAGATGVVLTKLDGTPKGGCIIGVHEKLGLPIRFVGVGEKIDDLIFFSATDFAEALLPEVPQHKKEETEQAGEEQA